MICKILALFKNHLNYLEDNIFECFFKKYNRFSSFLKKIITYNDGKPKAWTRNHNYRYKKSFQTKKKPLNYTAIKDISNLFRLEKKTKAIKDRILRDIKNLFEHEEENYYKPVRVNNSWSNNYIECESNGDRN